MSRLCIVLFLLLAGCVAAPPRTGPLPPRASHHQHLLSPAVARFWNEAPPSANAPPNAFVPFDADALVAQLDAAGIRRALVLSVAYTFGNTRRTVADEAVRVREENDWTVAQAARHPRRLVAFCGVSPLRDYALAEIDRCARELKVRGLKLHLGNSGVDLRNAEHVARLRAVFGAADARGLAIVVHMKTRNPDYGRRDAEIFLADVLTAAPNVPVQIAHLAGSGPGYPAFADAALSVFADAAAARDPRLRHVWYDVTTVVTNKTDPATAALVARRIRELGVGRVVFGADLAVGGNPPPREAWAAFRTLLPLTDAEYATIAKNVAPTLAR